jgi:hypothetical protein
MTTNHREVVMKSTSKLGSGIALMLTLLLFGCGGGGSGGGAAQPPQNEPVEEPGTGAPGEDTGGGSGGGTGGTGDAGDEINDGTGGGTGDGTGGGAGGTGGGSAGGSGESESEQPPQADQADPVEAPGSGGTDTGGDTGGTDGGDTGGTDGGTTQPQFSLSFLPVGEFGFGFERDFNDLGQIAYSNIIWGHEEGQFVTLSSPQEGVIVAEQLSDNSWAIGTRTEAHECTEDGLGHAMVWRPDGTVALDGVASFSSATDINVNNVVVGIFSSVLPCPGSPDEPKRFFRWDESGLVDLDRLGVGGNPGTIQINDQGALAFLTEGDGTFVRDASGTQQEIPNFVDVTEFTNSGIVAGCVLDGTDIRPAIWTAENGLELIAPNEEGCISSMNEAGNAVIDQVIYWGGELYSVLALLPEDFEGEVQRVVAINDNGEILLDTTRGPAVLDPVAE